MIPSIQTCTFLNLPREIRDVILGELFFPGEREPEEIKQNSYGLAPTTVREISPYNVDESRKPKFETAIIRTCQQLQDEAEAVLYGTSSFNLMYQDWDDRNGKLSYEFFEKLPRRLRRLVRRVERKCYSEPYRQSISPRDWHLFMTFLARECSNLQSLKLWGPGDHLEGPRWVETCKMDRAWVRDILQIKSLRYFDIPVIPGGVIYDFPEFAEDFLPRLKAALCQQPASNIVGQGVSFRDCHNSQSSVFRFLDLDVSIRKRVYRHLLLPPNKRVHPYLKPWYDQTTNNTIPLFLTCKKIHQEAEVVLYGESIYTSLMHKYDSELRNFLMGGKGTPVRLLKLIKHIRLGYPYGGHVQTMIRRRVAGYTRLMGDPLLLNWIVGNMDLESLELVIQGPTAIARMNFDWELCLEGHKGSWRGLWHESQLRKFAQTPRLLLDLPEEPELNPHCLEWLTVGLRKKYLARTDDSPELAWLYEIDERGAPDPTPFAAAYGTGGGATNGNSEEMGAGSQSTSVSGYEIP